MPDTTIEPTEPKFLVLFPGPGKYRVKAEDADGNLIREVVVEYADSDSDALRQAEKVFPDMAQEAGARSWTMTLIEHLPSRDVVTSLT